jgi:hypothetical protein
VLVVVLVGACARHAAPPAGTLRGTIIFPPHDTIPFDLPAAMHRCSLGHSLLLEGVGYDGSGVMLRLRFPDSVPADSVPIILPTDTTTPAGASVAVRYFVHDTPHSTALDSGSVYVRRQAGMIGARIVGTGIENAIHTPTRLEFRNVAWASDTVPCTYAP